MWMMAQTSYGFIFVQHIFSVQSSAIFFTMSTVISHQEELLTSIHPNLSLISSQYWFVVFLSYLGAAAVKPLKNSLQNITLILIFHTRWFVELANSNVSLGHEFKNEGFGPGTVILCDQVLTEGKQKDVLKAAGALFSHICEV